MKKLKNLAEKIADKWAGRKIAAFTDPSINPPAVSNPAPVSPELKFLDAKDIPRASMPPQLHVNLDEGVGFHPNFKSFPIMDSSAEIRKAFHELLNTPIAGTRITLKLFVEIGSIIKRGESLTHHDKEIINIVSEMLTETIVRTEYLRARKRVSNLITKTPEEEMKMELKKVMEDCTAFVEACFKAEPYQKWYQADTQNNDDGLALLDEEELDSHPYRNKKVVEDIMNEEAIAPRSPRHLQLKHKFLESANDLLQPHNIDLGVNKSFLDSLSEYSHKIKTINHGKKSYAEPSRLEKLANSIKAGRDKFAQEVIDPELIHPSVPRPRIPTSTTPGAIDPALQNYRGSKPVSKATELNAINDATRLYPEPARTGVRVSDPSAPQPAPTNLGEAVQQATKIKPPTPTNSQIVDSLPSAPNLYGTPEPTVAEPVKSNVPVTTPDPVVSPPIPKALPALERMTDIHQLDAEIAKLTERYFNGDSLTPDAQAEGVTNKKSFIEQTQVIRKKFLEKRLDEINNTIGVMARRKAFLAFQEELFEGQEPTDLAKKYGISSPEELQEVDTASRKKVREKAKQGDLYDARVAVDEIKNGDLSKIFTAAKKYISYARKSSPLLRVFTSKTALIVGSIYGIYRWVSGPSSVQKTGVKEIDNDLSQNSNFDGAAIDILGNDIDAAVSNITELKTSNPEDADDLDSLSNNLTQTKTYIKSLFTTYSALDKASNTKAIDSLRKLKDLSTKWSAGLSKLIGSVKYEGGGVFKQNLLAVKQDFDAIADVVGDALSGIGK